MASTDNIAFCDFETKSEMDIEHGAFAYAAHQSTDILIVAYCIGDSEPICAEITDQEKIEPLLEHMRFGGICVAHNILFEMAIIKYVAVPKYGWPKTKITQWFDTMHLAGRAGLPLSLAECAKALKITEKLEAGKDLIKVFCTPPFVPMNSRPKEKERFMEYCNQDVRVSREIWRNLPSLKLEEKEDIALDLRANFHGVPIDHSLAKRIHNLVLEEQAGLSDRVNILTKGVITKMTQAQRIKQWAQRHVSPSIPNCAAATVIEILDGVYGEVDPVTKEILEMRQHSGKSSTGKYVRYVHSSIDENIYGMLISFGAHTGRSISKLLNLYNLPKPSIKYDTMDKLIDDMAQMSALEINEKYGSYLKAASTAIRGVITAPTGKTLVIADYASIEARMVFWLAHCMSGLKKYHKGIDLYIDMASFIYSTPMARVTDDQRWLGKQVILGAGYGLGWGGFIGACAQYGVEIDESTAQLAINAYRETYPEIVDLWNDMDRSAMKACTSGKIVFAAKGKIAFKTMKTRSGVTFLLMRLPSGRFISYPDIKIEMVTTPWGARRKAISYKKAKNNGWFRDTTYGGKLTENAVQGIARDIMYYGAKVASDYGYKMLFSVYDEIVALADKDKADIRHYEELICTLPAWATGAPIKAEGILAKHYQKL